MVESAAVRVGSGKKRRQWFGKVWWFFFLILIKPSLSSLPCIQAKHKLGFLSLTQAWAVSINLSRAWTRSNSLMFGLFTPLHAKNEFCNVVMSQPDSLEGGLNGNIGMFECLIDVSRWSIYANDDNLVEQATSERFLLEIFVFSAFIFSLHCCNLGIVVSALATIYIHTCIHIQTH